MRRRSKALLAAAAGAAGIALALPALGQDAPQSILPPGFGQPAKPAPAAPAPPVAATAPSAPPPAPGDAAASAAPGTPPPAAGADEGVAVSDAQPDALDALVNAVTAQGQELPDAARRPLDLVGPDPVYGSDAFGDADGRFLATLMRRIQAPLASRWAEIMLRRALQGATPAPRGEGQADWVADRAALLLRMGEADAARQLVQGVDVANFSPRLRRVAIESALASSDPAGLCPISDGSERVGGQPAWPLIRAMCATLSGDEATANASIGRAPPGDPIDHALAEKLVAAGGGGRRNVTIDWTAVDSLTDWRFGLASALNVPIPPALLSAGPSWFEAWLARAPMLSTADRIAHARIAAVLGTLSSADLVDLYSRMADEAGDPDTGSPAGRLRAAYRGDGEEARLSALHALWNAGPSGAAGERERYAAAILTARAAALVAPAAQHRDELVPLLGAMFAAGLDRPAARWGAVAEAAPGGEGDRAWSILAVGAERPVVTISADRLQGFAKRAGGDGRHRVAMLAAALAGLGRLDPAAAAKLASDAGQPIGGASAYGRALEQAASARAPGPVAVLVALGMQTPRWGGVPAADFYRMIAALRMAGLDGEARMIAAEAMTRL